MSERSERATITISKLYIYLILPCIYFLLLPNFVSDFGPHVALYYVEFLSVRSSIETSGSTGCHGYFNVPMCQTVGL